jgi:hypothetical protein
MDASNVLKTVQMLQEKAEQAAQQTTESAARYMASSSTPGAQASKPVRMAAPPSLGASIPEGFGWALGLGALGFVIYVMYKGTRKRSR